MRPALARIGAAVAMAAVLTSCSSGDGGDGASEPGGLSVAEVCGGGFAKDAAVTAALKNVMGGERFDEGSAKPSKALDELREDSREEWLPAYRPESVRYCWFWSAEGGGEKDLMIETSAVRKAPGLHPDHAKVVTSYASGLQAFSSSGLGFLYFSCGLKPPAHDIVVELKVRGPAGVPREDLEQRTRLITLGSAMARKISGELGCQGDGLATGVPVAIPNPSSTP
ncbi:hypothetical protein [Streptomyces sp. NPDC017868]|uniref:hypothetical protein n=1 Tax=Streptomyces sp. NPDC017868 TaxID=3365014 RepID=UPI00379F0E2A